MGGFISKVVAPVNALAEIAKPNIISPPTAPQMQDITTNIADYKTNYNNDPIISELLLANNPKGIAANILTSNNGLKQMANIGRKLLLGQ